MRARIALALGLTCALTVSVSFAATGLYPLTDDELSGPVQPIQFSHKVHAGLLAMDCQYCHWSAARSQHATIPAVSICMGCHQWVKQGTSEGSVEEIARLQQIWDSGQPIAWVRVHNLPEYVQFKHNRHVFKKIECQTCHGQVQEMNRIWMPPDTRYNPSSAFLPAAKLMMGWCVDCHLQLQGSRDCAACHF